MYRLRISVVMLGERYHFLDGLRGVAMLLGLVLHASISLMGWPIWPAVDVKSNPETWKWLLDAIHGFRMPLFFLVSGFFTMMLTERRGRKGLLKQRLLRIGVPLLAGTIILSPLLFGIGAWGEERKKDNPTLAKESSGVPGPSLFRAILKDDLKEVSRLLGEGGNPDQRNGDGTSLISYAAILDRPEAIALLLGAGADVNYRSKDEGTAAISAAFFGRLRCLKILIENHADIAAEDRQGTSAIEAATMSIEFVKAIAGAFQIPLSENVEKDRRRCAELLEDAGAQRAADLGDQEIFDLLRYFPLFHHLWFLYYLIWLLIPFLFFGKFLKKLPTWLVASPWALLWLIPLTWQLQLMMPDQFGPATATGILPLWPKLGYYAIFFFYGAACFGRGYLEEKMGRQWKLLLPLSFALLWHGVTFLDGKAATWAHLSAAVYCWTMIYIFMGLFRQFLNRGYDKIRYLSDASYWLYLMHMPLMLVIQISISEWEAPALLKFVIILVVTTVPLLLIYDWMVRYTWIGAILNGRKSRRQPPVLPNGNGS